MSTHPHTLQNTKFTFEAAQTSCQPLQNTNLKPIDNTTDKMSELQTIDPSLLTFTTEPGSDDRLELPSNPSPTDISDIPMGGFDFSDLDPDAIQLPSDMDLNADYSSYDNFGMPIVAQPSTDPFQNNFTTPLMPMMPQQYYSVPAFQYVYPQPIAAPLGFQTPPGFMLVPIQQQMPAQQMFMPIQQTYQQQIPVQQTYMQMPEQPIPMPVLQTPVQKPPVQPMFDPIDPIFETVAESSHAPSPSSSVRRSTRHKASNPDFFNTPRAAATRKARNKNKGQAYPGDNLELQAPFSVLTKDSAVPLRDMHTHATRPIHERHGEAAKAGKTSRPWNAFILYRAAYSGRIREFVSSDSNQSISRLSARSWTMEPKSIKDFYIMCADVERENHKKAFPEYKYKPKNTRGKSRVTPDDDDDDEVDLDDGDGLMTVLQTDRLTPQPCKYSLRSRLVISDIEVSVF